MEDREASIRVVITDPDLSKQHWLVLGFCGSGACDVRFRFFDAEGSYCFGISILGVSTHYAESQKMFPLTAINPAFQMDPECL